VVLRRDALLLAAGGALVASGVNLVRLSIAAGVANALLLPVALGFPFFLARTALPELLRLRGVYGAAIAFAFLTVAGVGVGSAIAGWLWE